MTGPASTDFVDVQLGDVHLRDVPLRDVHLSDVRAPLVEPSSPHYPDAAPYRQHLFDVGGGHALCVREWGNPAGEPVLLLHGGPGSGASPLLWRSFNPSRYRVIAPDQRGAGSSQPPARLAHNALPELLQDLRCIREHLNVQRWWVVGGSWGATLALAHAHDNPQAVRGLLLRAVFLARDSDLDQFFAPPTAALLQAKGAQLGRAWAHLSQTAAPAPGQSLLQALHQGLQPDAALVRRAELAQAWWAYEQALDGPSAAWAASASVATETATATATATATPTLQGAARVHQLQRYAIQTHYLIQGCGLRVQPLLQRCDALAQRPDIPILILHGDQDAVCPPANALHLKARLPHSRLQWVAGAGHSPAHPAMAAALRQALDRGLDKVQDSGQDSGPGAA